MASLWSRSVASLESFPVSYSTHLHYQTPIKPARENLGNSCFIHSQIDPLNKSAETWRGWIQSTPSIHFQIEVWEHDLIPYLNSLPLLLSADSTEKERLVPHLFLNGNTTEKLNMVISTLSLEKQMEIHSPSHRNRLASVLSKQRTVLGIIPECANSKSFQLSSQLWKSCQGISIDWWK